MLVLRYQVLYRRVPLVYMSLSAFAKIEIRTTVKHNQPQYLHPASTVISHLSALASHHVVLEALVRSLSMWSRVWARLTGPLPRGTPGILQQRERGGGVASEMRGNAEVPSVAEHVRYILEKGRL